MKPHRLLPFALPLLLALNACQSGPRTVTLQVTKVAFPASVGAGADLPVTVTVTVGGCTTFQGFAAERSAQALRLTAQGTEPDGHVACPAYIGYADRLYTDPGSPARSDPFEVFVNGQSYGLVAVR